MKIESIAENSLLYDFYGQLLSKRQQEVMALYHEENLSLSEIADEFGISRQAVHDTLKKAEMALIEYEQKLGLVEKLVNSRQAIAEIDCKIEKLIEDLDTEAHDAEKQKCRELQGSEVLSTVPKDQKAFQIIENLRDIKKIIDQLDD